MHRGQAAFQNGQFSNAAIYLMNAIRIDPEYVEAHALLAQDFLAMEQPGNAYKELRRTLELRPDDYRSRLALVNLLVAAQNYHEAQSNIDVLLKQRPNDPAVHMSYSAIHAARGHITDAIAEVEKTIDLAPREWESYLALGILQSNSDHPETAEASFKRVVAMQPSNPQARVLLGNYYWARQRYADAEEQYKQTISMASGAFLPRDALAQLYLAEGKQREAELVLEQAIHDLPEIPDSYLALSELYASTGNAQKALEECAAIHHAHPDDIPIAERYVSLLIATRHYDEAHQLNESILRQDAHDSGAMISRGRMQLIMGNIAGATDSFRAALKSTPDDAEAHYLLGEANHARGDSVHDQTEWQESARLNPNNVLVQRELSRVALRQQNFNSLFGYATQIIRLAPNSPDGFALRALCAINEGHLDEAESDVQHAIAANPKDALGYTQQGNLRIAQGRFADAQKAFQDALDRNPQSIDGLRGLMNTLMMQKQPDKAVAVARAQVLKAPGNPAFYDLLGNALFMAKSDPTQAEPVLAKALELDPADAETLANLCMVKAARGNIDGAIALGEQFLQKDPNSVQILLMLGSFYQSKLQWEKASRVYHTVLTFDTLNPVASNELARVLLVTGGNPDAALQLAQTAAQGFPQAARVYDTLGWAYYQKKVDSLAIANLKRSLALQEQQHLVDTPDLHYHLGLAYARSGQSALARQQLQRVMLLSPNYPDAPAVQKELAQLKP